MKDPFKVKKLESIIDTLRTGTFDGCTACSVDVVDLFYTPLTQPEFLRSVKECTTEDNDEHKSS